MPRAPTLDEAAISVILRAADRLRRRYAPLLAPHGVTLQQYNVLRILRGAGPAGLPTLTLVDRMIEQAPGITRLLGRLVRRGWVIRRRDGRDQRIVVCRITAAGRRLLGRLDGPVAAADSAAVASLPLRHRARVVALLTPIANQSA
ncbi:MAG: MarR family winged helix-turn-helix transcriptional regulator [Gemmatimonadales bacterium]